MIDLTGKKIGRYKILKSIGEGGMATVYLAEDVNLERQVAVKVIRAERVTPEQLPRIMERFKREARALAKLSDEPGIVTVYDYGEYEGTPYLVMAYMPGGTLKDRLGSPVQAQAAAEMLLPIASALGAAHAQGMVHRDVKPSNLLVDKYGSLALADFGIAKALEMQDQTLTSTGMGVGTPEYMAPEQWRGQASPQTDVYALGVVLYEMLTGKKPFHAENPSDIYLKQMTEEPPDPARIVDGVPASAAEVLKKAMARQPEERYVDMEAFSEALEGITVGMPLHDETPAAVPQPVVEQDIEATYDELATPAPLGETPLASTEPEVKKDEPRAAKTKKDGRSGRKWWLLGVGAVVALALLWGIVAGQKKAAPVVEEVVVTDTSIPAETLQPTETPVPTLTSTATLEPTATAIPTPTLGIGSTKISDKDGMEMVYVPAGMFIMGSMDGDSDEQPVHEVYLDAFWIDKYEVTNAQYAQCVAAGACAEPLGNNYQDPAYSNHPVVYVTWTDAKGYCEWAGRKLPTEAEWEKAARGTDGRVYPWGNQEPLPSMANYDFEKDNRGGTLIVGSYPESESPYGVLDMTGNVEEWTSSSKRSYPYSPEDGREETGRYGDRVLRGGSFLTDAEYIVSSSRWGNRPSGRYSMTGFRCSVSEAIP
jgi:serine/threonine-protein kinase